MPDLWQEMEKLCAILRALCDEVDMTLKPGYRSDIVYRVIPGDRPLTEEEKQEASAAGLCEAEYRMWYATTQDGQPILHEPQRIHGKVNE